MRKGMNREDSTDSARAELLDDVEPVDYMESSSLNFHHPSSITSPNNHPNCRNTDSLSRLYQGADTTVLWSSSNVQGRGSLQPLRGIFDDV